MSAPMGVFHEQPTALHVMGVGAIGAPPDCTATWCWGTDQSTVLRSLRATGFNFGASLDQAGTVTITFTSQR